MNARLVISVATISPTIIVTEPHGPAGIIVVDNSDPVQVEVIIVKIVAISNITEPIRMHS